jgi:hypothetical protein
MDIVERLKTVDISWSQEGELCAEAANEIEQLREENNDLKSALMNVLFSEVSHVEITEFTKEKE